MDLEFDYAEIPASAAGRTAEPNPFTEVFPSDEKALVVTVANDKKVIAKVKTQARKAAHAVDRTARVSVAVESRGTGKNRADVAVLTLWTIPRIVHAKPAEEAATE